MSGKRERQVRKEMNKIANNYRVTRQKVADDCVRELLNAPFKYRF